MPIHLIISQPVICVHSRWVTAPIFWSLVALRCYALSSCAPSSILLSWTFSLRLFTTRSVKPIPQALRYVCISCPVARRLPPRTAPGQRGPVGRLAALCPPRCQRCGRRKYSSSKSIRDSSIKNTRLQTHAVFFKPPQSPSRLIGTIMVRHMHDMHVPMCAGLKYV